MYMYMQHGMQHTK